MRKTCLEMVHQLAKADDRVVFIGSDLGPGLLDDMRIGMPDRYYMEGVAEQNIIGMAAGMALEGFVPYVNTIATFITRRCYEQVAIDLALQNQNVRLIGNGGGVVYAPLGSTHLAIEDIAIFRVLPNMTVVCPSDAEEMKRFMKQSVDWQGPIYIRLGKGGDPVISSDENGFEIGRGIMMRDGGDVLVISTGVMTGRCLKAAEHLEADGISSSVMHLHTVKPLDIDLLVEKAAKAKRIVAVEEHVVTGGLGSAILEALSDKGALPPTGILRLGIPDKFPTEYGSQDSMLESFGLQPDGIAKSIHEALAG